MGWSEDTLGRSGMGAAGWQAACRIPLHKNIDSFAGGTSKRTVRAVRAATALFLRMTEKPGDGVLAARFGGKGATPPSSTSDARFQESDRRSTTDRLRRWQSLRSTRTLSDFGLVER